MDDDSPTHTAQIISSLAHDLRSPLNAVIGFSRVLLKGIDGPLSEMQATDLQAIQCNGAAMLEMVDNLIDLAKAEAGWLVPERTRFSVQPLVDRVCCSSGATSEVFPQTDAIPCAVLADKGMVQKAMERTMQAAIYLAGGGQVTLAVHSITAAVCVTFECTAPQGLAADTPHILGAFHSHGASRQDRLDRPALNLLVSASLLALNGGTLEVEQRSPTALAIRLILPPSLSIESLQIQQGVTQ